VPGTLPLLVPAGGLGAVPLLAPHFGWHQLVTIAVLWGTCVLILLQLWRHRWTLQGGRLRRGWSLRPVQGCTHVELAEATGALAPTPYAAWLHLPEERWLLAASADPAVTLSHARAVAQAAGVPLRGQWGGGDLEGPAAGEPALRLVAGAASAELTLPAVRGQRALVYLLIGGSVFVIAILSSVGLEIHAYPDTGLRLTPLSVGLGLFAVAAPSGLAWLVARTRVILRATAEGSEFGVRGPFGWRTRYRVEAGRRLGGAVVQAGRYRHLLLSDGEVVGSLPLVDDEALRVCRASLGEG